MQVPIAGEIRYNGQIEPENYKFCHGQWLRASDYPALYGIMGGVYGERQVETENGTVTEFRLPDRRGNAGVGAVHPKNVGVYEGEVRYHAHNAQIDRDKLSEYNDECGANDNIRMYPTDVSPAEEEAVLNLSHVHYIIRVW